jgi:signal transduction histidine kinase
MSLSPIETEDGLLFASAIRDITERKELEKQIADRTDQEQRRIGQDLHDSIGQQVTGISMLAKSLLKRLEAKGEAEAAAVAELVESIRQAQSALRNLSRGLLPVELEANGLVHALNNLARRNRILYKTDCVYEGDEEVPIRDGFTANHLYRIAQEAIHNAMKHGRARRIVVSVRTTGGRVVLQVRDDGIGLGGVEPASTGGMGIRIMQYRAGLIGATLDIESARDRGTVVTCTLDRDDAQLVPGSERARSEGLPPRVNPDS